MMLRRTALFPALAAIAVLPGCAKDADLYPSLSIRDEERVSGVFQPVESDPYVPAPPGQPVLDRIAALRADAADANGRFMAAADRARSPVSQAKGAETGSEAWALAQVALADLESSRSDAMIALADLDRIFVDAELEAAQTAQISEARDEVASIVQAQDRLIDSLHEQLSQ